MQKVITALEHLEVLVQKNDTELLLIEDLRSVSVAEPQNFDAVPGKIFEAAPDPIIKNVMI
jgi:hypothetical protein